MRVVLREEIILSRKEYEAFDLVEKVLDGLQREAKDKSLLREVESMLNLMSNIFGYIARVENVEER